MMFVFILPIAILGFSLLALPATAICWLGWRPGLLRKSWHFTVSIAVLTGIWPTWSLWQDHIRTAECIRINGPGEVMCTGELAGAFLEIFTSALIALSLSLAPLLGRSLARRWLRA